ncbi:MAG: AarF/UbiB family protein [bacterium]|nr:AarF/UbiB family protein [bacterium]
MLFSERQQEALGASEKARERIERRPHRRIGKAEDGSVVLKYLPTAPEEEPDVKDELFGEKIRYKEERVPIVDITGKEPKEWEYERARKENGTVPLDREKEDVRRAEKEKRLFEETKKEHIEFVEERFGTIEEGEAYQALRNITRRLEENIVRTYGVSVRLKPVLVNSLDINAYVFNRDTITRSAIQGKELPIFMNMGLILNYQKYLRKRKFYDLLPRIKNSDYEAYCEERNLDPELPIRTDNYSHIFESGIVRPGQEETVRAILNDEKYRLTEDKLAFIMAHELGHLFQSWEDEGIARAVLGSSVKEKDADQRGFRLMNEAGYNPRAALTGFEFFLSLQGGSLGNSLLESYPPSDERRNDLIKLLDHEDQLFQNANKPEEGEILPLLGSEYEAKLYQGDVWKERIAKAGSVEGTLEIVRGIKDPNELIVLLPYLARIVNTAEMRHTVESSNVLPETILTRLLMRKRIFENKPRLFRDKIFPFLEEGLPSWSDEEREYFYDVLSLYPSGRAVLRYNSEESLEKRGEAFCSHYAENFKEFFEGLSVDKQEELLTYWLSGQGIWRDMPNELIRRERDILNPRTGNNKYAEAEHGFAEEQTREPYLAAPYARVDYTFPEYDDVLNSSFRYEDEKNRGGALAREITLDMSRGTYGEDNFLRVSRWDETYEAALEADRLMRERLQAYAEETTTEEERALIAGVTLEDFAEGRFDQKLLELIPELESYLQTIDKRREFSKEEMLKSRRGEEDQGYGRPRYGKNEYYDSKLDPIEKPKRVHRDIPEDAARGRKQYLADIALLNARVDRTNVLGKEYENLPAVREIQEKMIGFLEARYGKKLDLEHPEVGERFREFIGLLYRLRFDVFLKPKEKERENEVVEELQRFMVSLPNDASLHNAIVEALTDETLLDPAKVGFDNGGPTGPDKKRQAHNGFLEQRSEAPWPREILLSLFLRSVEDYSTLTEENLRRVSKALPESHMAQLSYYRRGGCEQLSNENFYRKYYAEIDVQDLIKRAAEGDEEALGKLAPDGKYIRILFDSSEDAPRVEITPEERLRLYEQLLLKFEGDEEQSREIRGQFFNDTAMSIAERAELIRRRFPAHYPNFVSNLEYRLGGSGEGWHHNEALPLKTPEDVNRLLELIEYLDRPQVVFDRLTRLEITDAVKERIDALYAEIENQFHDEPTVENAQFQEAHGTYKRFTKNPEGMREARERRSYENKLLKLIIAKKAPSTLRDFERNRDLQYSTVAFAREEYLKARKRETMGEGLYRAGREWIYGKVGEMRGTRGGNNYFERALDDDSSIAKVNLIQFFYEHDATPDKKTFRAFFQNCPHFFFDGRDFHTTEMLVDIGFGLNLNSEDQKKWFGRTFADAERANRESSSTPSYMYDEDYDPRVDLRENIYGERKKGVLEDRDEACRLFADFCGHITMDDINAFVRRHKDEYIPGNHDYRLIGLLALGCMLRDGAKVEEPALFPEENSHHKGEMLDAALEDGSHGGQERARELAAVAADTRREKIKARRAENTLYDFGDLEFFYTRDGLTQETSLAKFREKEALFCDPTVSFEEKVRDLKDIAEEGGALYRFLLRNVFHAHLYGLVGKPAEDYRIEIDLDKQDLDAMQELVRSLREGEHAGENVLIRQYPLYKLELGEFFSTPVSRKALDEMLAALLVYAGEDEESQEYYSRVVFNLYVENTPEFFKDFDTALDTILDFFPYSSPYRDSILNELLLQGAHHYEQYEQINKFFHLESKDIGEKTETSEATIGKDKAYGEIRNRIRKADRTEKMRTVFWLLGGEKEVPEKQERQWNSRHTPYGGEKPEWLEDNELKFLASFDGYRKAFWQADPEERFEMVYDFMLSENGVFRDDIGDRRTNEEVMNGFVEDLYRMIVRENDISFEIDGRENPKFAELLETVFKNTFRLYSPERRTRLFLALVESIGERKRAELEHGEPSPLQVGEMIKVFLNNMGILGVKIGQILSEREDVPQEIRRALADFKDSAPPFSKKICYDYLAREGLVETELGKKSDKPVRAIDGPLNFASIKGVFLCDHEGEPSILKFRRPTIEKYHEEDKRVMREIFRELEEKFEIPMGVLQEAIEVCEDELDFEKEAENHRQLLENNTRRNPQYGEWTLKVPELHECREEMIIEERVKGVTLAETEFLCAFGEVAAGKKGRELENLEKRRNRVIQKFGSQYGLEGAEAERLILEVDVPTVQNAVGKEFFTELLEDGTFHSDLHKGNIMVDPMTRRVTLIDCGSVGHLAEEGGKDKRRAVKSLVSSLHFGFAEHAARTLADAFIDNASDEERATVQEIFTEVFNEKEGIDGRLQGLYWKLIDKGIVPNKDFKMVLKGLISGYSNFGNNVAEVFKSYLDGTDNTNIVRNIYAGQEGGTLDRVLGSLRVVASEVDLRKYTDFETLMNENFETVSFLFGEMSNMPENELSEARGRLPETIGKITAFAREMGIASQMRTYIEKNEDQIVRFLLEKNPPRWKLMVPMVRREMKKRVITPLLEGLSS